MNIIIIWLSGMISGIGLTYLIFLVHSAVKEKNKKKAIVIETKKLNELLEDFKEYKFEDETFQEFVEGTKDDGKYITKMVEVR